MNISNKTLDAIAAKINLLSRSDQKWLLKQFPCDMANVFQTSLDNLKLQKESHSFSDLMKDNGLNQDHFAELITNALSRTNDFDKNIILSALEIERPEHCKKLALDQKYTRSSSSMQSMKKRFAKLVIAQLGQQEGDV